MDKSKYTKLMKAIEDKNKEYETNLEVKINSNSKLNEKFKSLKEYYSWVNDTIKKLLSRIEL